MLRIIWDMDGTLIDSNKELRRAIDLSAKESGLDLSKQIKPFIVGPTIDKILRDSFPVDYINDTLLNKVIASFRNFYDNSDFELTKPYPGIENIISDTEHFTHYIVTNKPDMPTNRILNKLNWSNSITRILTPYSKFNALENKKRSKTELFTDILAESGADISSFIGIGDMKTDCHAAKENKITAVGVLWGSGSREELSDCCDYLFEDSKQLHDFLYEITKHKRSA